MIRPYYLFLFASLSFLACQPRESELPLFTEAWPLTPSPYLGPDYIPSEPSLWYSEHGKAILRDTRVGQGLTLLPFQLCDTTQEVRAAVLVQFLNPDSLRKKQSFLGFGIRTHPWAKPSLVAGLTAEGKLFIQDIESAEALAPLDPNVAWELRLNIERINQGYQVYLAAHAPGTRRREEYIKKRITKNEFPLGYLSLHANGLAQYEKGRADEALPMAWFDAWDLSGQGLKPTHEKWGPIIATRTGEKKDRRILQAYLAPLDAESPTYLALEIDQGKGFELYQELRLDAGTQRVEFDLPQNISGKPSFRLRYPFRTEAGTLWGSYEGKLPEAMPGDSPVKIGTLPLTPAQRLWTSFDSLVQTDRPDMVLIYQPPLQGRVELDQWYQQLSIGEHFLPTQPILFVPNQANWEDLDRRNGKLINIQANWASLNVGSLSLALSKSSTPNSKEIEPWLENWSQSACWKAYFPAELPNAASPQSNTWSKALALNLRQHGDISLVSFDPNRRRATWKLGSNRSLIEQVDLGDSNRKAYLPYLRVPSSQLPVLSIRESGSRKLVGSFRLPSKLSAPSLPDLGSYHLTIRYPEAGITYFLNGIEGVEDPDQVERIILKSP